MNSHKDYKLILKSLPWKLPLYTKQVSDDIYAVYTSKTHYIDEEGITKEYSDTDEFEIKLDSIFFFKTHPKKKTIYLAQLDLWRADREYSFLEVVDFADEHSDEAFTTFSAATFDYFLEDSIYISMIEVDERERGKGYSKVIFDWLLDEYDEASQIILTTAEDSLQEYYVKRFSDFYCSGYGQSMTFNKVC